MVVQHIPTAATALVGRERELHDACELIYAGLAGAGGLLLVTGEAGIGKSRLVDALAVHATERGARALRGTCWDDPGTPALWAWRNVVRDCADAFDVPVDPALGPLFGVGDEAEGPPAQLRLRLFDSVAALLREAARRHPVLIVVEDLHFADAPSVALLRYLAATLRGQPVVLVATFRDPEPAVGSALADAVLDLVRAGRTMPLFGLDPEAVGDLVLATTGAMPAPRVTTTIHERTGGNPLFVIEVSKLLATRGFPETDDVPIPDSVRQVIAHRLAYLAGDTLKLLSVAAVEGQVFSATVLQCVTGEPSSRIADRLSEATQAGLIRALPQLGRFTFTHALVRDVLYAGVPSARRRARHRQFAEAIEVLHRDALDDHLTEVADHYVLALPDADAGRALYFARRAGERALAMLAWEEAVRHFTVAAELAREPTVEAGRRVELLLALGDAQMRAGDWRAATAAYEEAAAAARRRGRPDELARAAVGLGAGLSGFEIRLYDWRQIGLLREALDQLDEDSDLRAWVLARLSVAESFVVSSDVRIERCGDALRTARRSSDARLLVQALSSYCDAMSGPDHTEERLVLADEMVMVGQGSGHLESELLGRRFRLVARLETGDIAGVDAEIEAFELGASRLRWPLVEWYPRLWHGMRALIDGRLTEAERLEEEARGIGRRAGSINAEILTDALRLQRLLEQGRPEGAYEVLGRFLSDPEGGPNAEAWVALPLARMGRHAEARAVLDRLAAADFPLVVDGAWLEVIASVAEACAEVNHQEAATHLVRRLEPYAQRFATGAMGAICFGSMARHVALLYHCLGELDRADAYFHDALRANRHAGATLLIAHTLRQHAALLADRQRAGDLAEADALRTEANDTYLELGLDHWTDPGPTDAAPPSPRDLFRRDGDVWTLRFDGHEVLLRHVKGLTVLARLLAEPGREFHVSDLAAGASGAGLSAVPGSTGEVLDERARREYKRRLAELEAEIDEATVNADPSRAERAEIERTAIIGQLTAAYGLGGRARHGNDPGERARSTVTKQIHTALRRVARAHPALGRHLANSVTTGRYCSYTPEQPRDWDL